MSKLIDILFGYRDPEPSNPVLRALLGCNSSSNSGNISQNHRRRTSPKNVDYTSLQILANKGLPTNSQACWWVKYPKRALQEIRTMERNTNAYLTYYGNKLIWEEVVKNNFNTRFYISIETEGYPHKMPRVFVKDSDIKFKRRKHTYKDGSLCLMESSEYNSRLSVLQIRNQACAWCWAVEVYTHTKSWPAAEH